MATNDVPSFGGEAAARHLPGGGAAADAAIADDLPLQRRLVRLKRCVVASRASARGYLRTARALLRAASGAEQTAPVDLAAALCDGARETGRRAQKCLGFASLCRRRARRLADDGDSLFD